MTYDQFILSLSDAFWNAMFDFTFDTPGWGDDFPCNFGYGYI